MTPTSGRNECPSAIARIASEYLRGMPNIRIQSLPVPTAITLSNTSVVGNGLLNEQPVDDLVDRTVAADYDNLAETVVDGLDGQFDRMVLPLGKYILGHDMTLAQQPADQRPVGQPPPLPATGLTIANHLSAISMSLYFSGALRSVSSR